MEKELNPYEITQKVKQGEKDADPNGSTQKPNRTEVYVLETV